jgi:hypothetical protein
LLYYVLGSTIGFEGIVSSAKNYLIWIVSGPNVVGSDLTTRPKTLLKETTGVGSCCLTEPNSVRSHSTRLKTLQKGVRSGCPARLTVLGSNWAAEPNITGFDCASIPKNIIICIINILNFIIINIKNIIICIKNIIFYYN